MDIPEFTQDETIWQIIYEALLKENDRLRKKVKLLHLDWFKYCIYHGSCTQRTGE